MPLSCMTSDTMRVLLYDITDTVCVCVCVCVRACGKVIKPGMETGNETKRIESAPVYVTVLSKYVATVFNKQVAS